MSEEQKKAAMAESQKGGAPDKAQLEKSVAVAKNVVELQQGAQSLKQQAMSAVNPKERIKLLQSAYEKEVEAHGQSKYAKMLQSGAFQGVMGGGGIGGGVALGTGAAVGTLLSGVVAVPTMLVGGLVGAGVGGIKGPFIKFGGGDSKDKMTEEEVRAKAVKEAEKLDAAVESGASKAPQPPKIDEEEGAADEVPPAETPKRTPKKLQARSSNVGTPTPGKKKPRKLEIRSGIDKKEDS